MSSLTWAIVIYMLQKEANRPQWLADYHSPDRGFESGLHNYEIQFFLQMCGSREDFWNMVSSFEILALSQEILNSKTHEIYNPCFIYPKDASY